MEAEEGFEPEHPIEVCPHCGSTDLPVLTRARNWACNECGEPWDDHASRGAQAPRETHEADERVMQRRSYPIFRVIVCTLLGVLILYYVHVQIRSY